MRKFIIEPSKVKSKKFVVYEEFDDGTISKRVNFGATGYEDFTMHKDSDRMDRYIMRHRSGENWSKTGIMTAGFWSRWILWNKPSMRGSINDTKDRFDIKITKLSKSSS